MSDQASRSQNQEPFLLPTHSAVINFHLEESNKAVQESESMAKNGKMKSKAAGDTKKTKSDAEAKGAKGKKSAADKKSKPAEDKKKKPAGGKKGKKQ
ncbi:unnamed protein product [Cylindrotheca closterium]|uniref:Uncharacterized protein n=1 Tax=Cylindrotheca closterium TaxID=2856 RepID=A0AAD2PX81_9STRA|nr:unnamed protein product [Cylindrotheca closterium]